ncbi:TetR family transcriptional regulator [Flexivirga sp.]|uniref:TetR family transcriptional regulator n=1 Tax=Flexivirga sp. TaxID=1962927 RepID=UPI003F7EDD68
MVRDAGADDAARPSVDADWSATVAGHKQRQLLRIGAIAAELVSSDGLGAVSMSRLARASGISRATLYNYVPDVVTAVRHHLTAQSEAFQAAVAAAVAEEEDPEAQLRRYIQEQVAYAAGADHRAAAALLESGAALGGSDPAAHQRRDSSVLEGILDRGDRAGTFRSGHRAARLTLISRLLYSSHELMHQQHVSRDDTVALITELILDGIRR